MDFEFEEFEKWFWDDEIFGSNYELAEWCRMRVPDLIQAHKVALKEIEELKKTIREMLPS